MGSSDDYENTLIAKIEEIHKLELEALRRAGVAKEKEKGLEIESTEAVRLFREAIGYILRLRELREDAQGDLLYNEYYNAAHVHGHLDDYNRILESIRENPSFESAVSAYEGAGHGKVMRSNFSEVTIEGRSQSIKLSHTDRHGMGGVGETKSNVPIEGSNVEMFVLPRLIRLTKDIENSLIGRCASGKRPG